jgi:ubiquitin-conjugating enzyme E2 variant
VLAQASHRWSHMKSPPGLAKVLQKVKIAQSPENHRRHHRAPFDENYCIVNGALNGVLARTNFWRHMERGVFKLTGAEPNCWKDPIIKEMALGKLSRAEALEKVSRAA